MPPLMKKNADLAKTLSYLVIHLAIGFTIAYLFTGSVAIAGGIALIEPCANAIAFFAHEKAWNRALEAPSAGQEQGEEPPEGTASELAA